MMVWVMWLVITRPASAASRPGNKHNRRARAAGHHPTELTGHSIERPVQPAATSRPSGVDRTEADHAVVALRSGPSRRKITIYGWIAGLVEGWSLCSHPGRAGKAGRHLLTTARKAMEWLHPPPPTPTLCPAGSGGFSPTLRTTWPPATPVGPTRWAAAVPSRQPGWWPLSARCTVLLLIVLLVLLVLVVASVLVPAWRWAALGVIKTVVVVPGILLCASEQREPDWSLARSPKRRK
jgi:hypothetical protein